MSSFRISLISLLFLGITACGFQPLYGSSTQNADVQNRLAGIYIPSIQGRTGQILRNELLDLTTPSGVPSQPRYTLNINLTESKTGLAIQEDDTKTRFNLTLNTQFQLVEVANGKKIYKGSTQNIASYNVVSSDFANLSAELNAEKRAALDSAKQIHQQLAVYFSGR
jgi:LPS-assembly lipoprotein